MCYDACHKLCIRCPTRSVSSHRVASTSEVLYENSAVNIKTEDLCQSANPAAEPGSVVSEKMDGSQDFVYMGTVKRSYTSGPVKRSIGLGRNNVRRHSEKTSPHVIQDDMSVFSDDTFVIPLDRRQSKSINDLRLDSIDLVIDGRSLLHALDMRYS